MSKRVHYPPRSLQTDVPYDERPGCFVLLGQGEGPTLPALHSREIAQSLEVS